MLIFSSMMILFNPTTGRAQNGKPFEGEVRISIPDTPGDSVVIEIPESPEQKSQTFTCTNFLQRPFVKSVIDLGYDLGTIGGIVLWSQSNPALSYTGAMVCLGSHILFGVIPRTIININQTVNSPPPPLDENQQENRIRQIVQKLVKKIKIVKEGENGSENLCKNEEKK